MRVRQTSVAHSEGARVTRLAWLASFLATLALIAILALAKSAQALTVPDALARATGPASSPPFDFEAEEEGEEEELEVEECEEGEEEECEEEAGSSGFEAPDECLLTGAEATVFASSAQDKLRLAVRYATSTPTLVAVAYGLHGSKGSLYLGQSRRQLGRSGVLRQTTTLSDAQMAKASGARDFIVQLYAVHAPHYCHHYLEQHLTVRHAAPSGLTWADPEASLRR
jgi:hypothetical protein